MRWAYSFILFALVAAFCRGANAGQAVNVEYIHAYIQAKAGVTVPIKASNVKQIANVEYLLAAVDKANEISPYSTATDYKNHPLATMQVVDTIATHDAVGRLHNCFAAGAWKNGLKCELCPRSNYCLANTNDKTSCPAGQITDNNGATVAGACHTADEDSIVLTVNSDEFVIPTQGNIGTSSHGTRVYDWQVSIDGGATWVQKTGTGSLDGIPLTGIPQTNGEYKIIIRPTVLQAGWALAFGWHNNSAVGAANALANRAKLKTVDYQYDTIHPIIPAGTTNADYYMYFAFYGVPGLTKITGIPALPDGVTSANYYLYYTFRNGDELTTASTIHALPSSVTSANYYLYGTFSYTRSLTTAPIIPALPNGVTSADYYLSLTFYNAIQLTNTTIANVPGLPASVTSFPSGTTTNYANGTQALPVTPLNSSNYHDGYDYH